MVQAHDFTGRVRAAEQKLFRIAYSVLRNEADCADAVQEALLKAWQKRGTLRDERLFDTWLVRIVINECYQLIRKHRSVIPVQEPQRPAEDQALHDALMALPDNLRLPIALHYAEGYTVAEVARMLRLPQGTVKNRLVRGRKQLRAELSGEGEGI